MKEWKKRGASFLAVVAGLTAVVTLSVAALGLLFTFAPGLKPAEPATQVEAVVVDVKVEPSNLADFDDRYAQGEIKSQLTEIFSVSRELIGAVGAPGRQPDAAAAIELERASGLIVFAELGLKGLSGELGAPNFFLHSAQTQARLEAGGSSLVSDLIDGTRGDGETRELVLAFSTTVGGAQGFKTRAPTDRVVAVGFLPCDSRDGRVFARVEAKDDSETPLIVDIADSKPFDCRNVGLSP